MTPFPTRLGSHAKLLGRMIRACGVDPAHLTHDGPGPAFITVARACMACRSTELCRAWLDRAEREGQQGPPTFCPNAERFRAARRA